jgi:hypothetical protein
LILMKHDNVCRNIAIITWSASNRHVGYIYAHRTTRVKIHTFVGKPCGSLAMFPVVMTSLEQVVLSPALTRLSMTLLSLDNTRTYYKLLSSSFLLVCRPHQPCTYNMITICLRLVNNLQKTHNANTSCGQSVRFLRVDVQLYRLIEF